MSDSIFEIKDQTFEQDVLQQQKPVIVDFWAPWCGPCKAMAPAFESLADTYEEKMLFAKCNVDENIETANRYGIRAIPTLMIFQGGEPIDSITGMVSQSNLEEAIDRALSGEATPAPFIVN